MLPVPFGYNIRMRHFFIKRSSASDYLLLFLVSAATSVLLTRLYLFLTAYPQITKGYIHLAHAIFGGALLSISNILLLTYHGRRARQASAVIAGLGFGQFIDELGKFITLDNNYFYQPVPMLIYICFIALFFVYRYLDEYTPLQPREIMYEVIERFEDIAEGRFFPQTKRKVEQWLEKLLEDSEETYHSFAKGTLLTIASMPLTTRHKDKKYVRRIKSSWKWLEEFTAERRPIFYFLLCLFLLYIVNTLLSTSSLMRIIFQRDFHRISHMADTRYEWAMVIGQVLSQVIAALFMIRGFIFLVRRHRARALHLFRNGLAVNILVTQVFNFYFKQFYASYELLFMLTLFLVIHNIIEEEKS
jgi:hypothetical protein